MRRIVAWGGAALILLSTLPGFSQSIFRKAPPDVEEALRKRVDQFYSLYRDGKFRQAEVLVAQESRELYYSMSKVPIRGFKVESIDWAKDFKTASVLVVFISAHPRAASANLPIPVTGKWKLVKGLWYLLIEKRENTPWGPMTFSDPRKGVPEAFQRPTPETLAVNAVRHEPSSLTFSARAGQPVSGTVTITNNMPGTVQLKLETLSVPGLQATLSTQNVAAKGQAKLQIQYDPRAGRPTGTTEVRVQVEPIGQVIRIPVEFQ